MATSTEEWIDELKSITVLELSERIKALEEEFGEDPDTWDADEAGDQIDFTPVGLQDQPNMQWQNRPTFQQVVEVRQAQL